MVAGVAAILVVALVVPEAPIAGMELVVVLVLMMVKMVLVVAEEVLVFAGRLQCVPEDLLWGMSLSVSLRLCCCQFPR